MKKHFIVLCLLATLRLVAFAQQHDHNSTSVVITGAFAQQHDHNNISDDSAFHGMLLIGKDAFYAYHLPMFMTVGPHNYQGIFKVKLDAAAAKLFQKDQAAHPEYSTYSIAPLEAFILPDMVAKPHLFKAQLYRGHFERGGEIISQSIDISIEKVVLFKKFDLTLARLKEAKFMVFGNGKERFIAHILSNKPDFDQIIQVNTGLAEGTEVILDASANNVVGVSGNGIFKGKEQKPFITLLKQIYVEFDDLLIVHPDLKPK